MCGLAGWLGDDPPEDSAEQILTAAQDLLRHRGPDGAGSARGTGFGLAFRRLAVLDLCSTGHQPMTVPGGRYVLVMNGEIYNYVELRKELETRGVRFAGTSDTEVLLHLLALDGPGALVRCNGMFAFVLVDTVAQRFVLGRDRLGVKPLYYATTTGQLRFASELKVLLRWPGEQPAVDASAVAAFLGHGHVPGDRCIVVGHRKLPPGHVLTGSLRRPDEAVLTRWWSLDVGGDEAAPSEELEALLEDAVRIRLRSDVPVGVFLSGGIDSGLVAALAGRVAEAPPLALTVGFAQQAYDESGLAGLTASGAGLEHVVVRQDQRALDLLDLLAWSYDEPFADSSALPTFALCEAARRYGVVWLSGDGGDEAFAGYRRYLQAARYERPLAVARPVAAAVRAAAGSLPPASLWRYRLVKATAPDSGYAAAFDSTPEDPLLALVAGDRVREHLADVVADHWTRWSRTVGRPLTARQQQLDYETYLPDDILVKVDRASMAHGLEVRSPLLDVRVVEWAARRRRTELLRGSEGKLPLRELGRRLLPPAVMSAQKRGFAAPVGDWLRAPEGAGLVRERLLAPGADALGLWSRSAVSRVLDAHVAGSSRGLDVLLWRLLVLDAWHRQHVRQLTSVGV